MAFEACEGRVPVTISMTEAAIERFAELVVKNYKIPNDHPLMVFACECVMGVYQEHEIPGAAHKAILATSRGGA
jgi:hypothetical protein